MSDDSQPKPHQATTASMIIQAQAAELTKAAHALKSIVGIKSSRASQRHAIAMGFESANHLIVALKSAAVERDFEQYMQVLSAELTAHHQITLVPEQREAIKKALTTQ